MRIRTSVSMQPSLGVVAFERGWSEAPKFPSLRLVRLRPYSQNSDGDDGLDRVVGIMSATTKNNTIGAGEGHEVE